MRRSGFAFAGNYQYEVTDVRAAWHDYLAHYNDGSGVVLIDHSEGAFLLRDLLADEYGKFSVAASTANFTIGETRKVFLAVAEAA